MNLNKTSVEHLPSFRDQNHCRQQNGPSSDCLSHAQIVVQIDARVPRAQNKLLRPFFFKRVPLHIITGGVDGVVGKLRYDIQYTYIPIQIPERRGQKRKLPFLV